MQEVLVSKIFNYTSTPTKNVEGQFWFNPSTNVLSRFNGTEWKPITVSSDDVAVLTDGSTVSLTSYLNTQIAALAEGIDSKQDKLLYYSETSGDTLSANSATISVANIKLTGNVAEGSGTRALGTNSHAEGGGTRATGIYSHTEGNNATASGEGSHAEGSGTTASGNYSHAEGRRTTASGEGSHAEGQRTTASGTGSHAEGYDTIASSDYQHTQGKYNIKDANDKYADIIGNGTGPSERSNAATVSWEGVSWSQTDVRAGGTDQDSATHSLAAKQNATDNTLETTDKTIVGAINELSADKQDTLQFYTESITDAPGYPSGSGIYKEQISLGKNNYSQTINIGGSNNLQNINLGGSVGTYGIITIGTTGNNNQIQIGRDNTSTALEINANTINGNAIDKTALTESSNKLPTSQAVLNGLSAKQNATDNNLTTTDKTIVGAINELSTDKQNTLKYYSESDSSTEPSSNNAQVSILKNSDYGGTLNLGFESSNGIQTINIGGSSNDRRINIGTKICGSYNNVTIGNASDGVLLTLNTGRGLAGTGVTKDLSTSATDAQFPTAAAVNNQLILKQNITDNSLTTTAKTIVGAINELKTATDAMVVVSTDNAINVAPTTAQTGVLIASSKTNGGNVIITPKITNTGACYLSTSSTYSNLNPIYPDPTNNKYTYPNLGTVYLFVDNAGDSADIVIENFAG